MFRNYLKIAWRTIRKNKGFTAINVLGLATGMTCTIFILLWVQDELAYDSFHSNYKRIYKLYANRRFDNQVFTDENMILPLAQTIEKEIPGVRRAVVITHRQPHVLTYGETKLKKFGYTVGDHFFDMFTWKFVQGHAATALPDPYAIVLTQSTARALFGNADPINKVIRVDNEYDAKVTAVVADVPGNSTLQFDFVNSFNYSNDFLKQAMGNWQNSSWNVFVEPVPGTDMRLVDKKINEIKWQHDPGDKKISQYFSFPMNKCRPVH